MIFMVLILILQCGTMALLKLLGINYNIEGATLIFIAIDCILFTLIGLTEIKKKTFYIFYCAAFFLRLLLLFIDYYFIKIMHSGMDTEGFFLRASQGFDIKLASYFFALSAFFEVVGIARLFAQFMNLCCGMISCLLVLKTLDVLHVNEKAKLIGFALVCFLPNWADLSVILMRESIIGVCVAIAIYYFALWFEKYNLSYLAVAIIATLPAVYLHSGLIIITTVISVSPIIYNPVRAKFKIKISTFLGLCGMLILCTYVIRFLPYLGRFELRAIFRMQNFGTIIADQVGSMYLVNLNASTWLEFILFTPIRWLYFYFSPMPWDWRGINDILAFVLSSAPTLFIFAYAVIAAMTSKHNRHLLLILLLSVVAFGIVYAWGTFSAGTAMRHRDKIVPIYAAILALSYDARLKRCLDYRIPKRILESFDLA